MTITSTLLFNLFLFLLLAVSTHSYTFNYGDTDDDSDDENVEHVHVQVDTSQVWAQTSRQFICVTLDWWPGSKAGGWENASLQVVDINAPLFRAALKALSPLHLRLGGSLQDQITYTLDDESHTRVTVEKNKDQILQDTSRKPQSWPDWNKCEPLGPSNDTYSHYQGGCFHLARLKSLAQMCQTVGCELVFGLSYFYGRQLAGKRDWSGQWNASNANLLLSYVRHHNLTLAGVELGNEVDGQSGILAHFPVEQYAHDLTLLRKLINHHWPKSCCGRRPLLLGTDTAHYNQTYTQDLLSRLDDNVLDGFSYHNYMLGMSEDDAISQRTLDPTFIEGYKQLAANVSRDVRQVHPHLQVWLGEAGGAAHSGRPGVTDVFISSFWYLDQLAQAALHDHQTFCRQTLVGGHYSLLESAHGPVHPDFYAAMLFRQLMGTQVLRATSTHDHLRAYTHCAREKRGHAVVLLLNLNRDKKAQVNVTFGENDPSCPPGTFRKDHVMSAVSGNIFGKIVLHNGKLLHGYGERLPTLKPRIVPCDQELVLPPVSYAFVSFPNDIAVCSEQ